MYKTTRKAPYDVTEIIPSLLDYQKVTVRLHPRRQESEPGPRLSKMGGRFLWPANEPWPRCTEPEYALSGEIDWSDWSNVTNIWPAEHPKHNDLYVGVLQLRADEFPEVEFPNGKDLFQLLWCPRDHLNEIVSKVCWWTESGIEGTLEMPSPSYPNEDLVPQVCHLYPERVTEYPHIGELSEEQLGELRSWDGEEGMYAYQALLSTCPGVKVGGYVNWIQDPEEPHCSCGSTMSHLLTVSSGEFDPISAQRWCPVEDWNAWERHGKEAAQIQVSPGLIIGDCGSIYVFICRRCDGWPTTTVFQCS